MASNSAFGSLLVQIAGSAVGLQKTVTEANGMLKNLSDNAKQMGDIMKTVFEFEFIKKGIESLNKFREALSDLASEGEKAQNIQKAFVGLAGSAESIEQARKATLGTVSAFDLMRVANEGLIRTIPKFNEQFGKITEFATRYAQANKREVLPTLEAFVDALAKGRTRGLEPFGFALEKNATRAQNQAAVTAQLAGQTERLAPVTDSAKKAQDALAVSIKEVFENIGIAVTSNKDLTDAFRNLTTQVDKINFKQLGTDLAEIASIFVNLAAKVLPEVVSQINLVALGIRSLAASSPTSTDSTAKLANLGSQIEILTKLKNQAIEVGSSQGSLNFFQTKIQELQAEYDGQLSLLKGFEQRKQQAEKDSEEKSAATAKAIQDKAEKDREAAALASTQKAQQQKIQSANDELSKIISKDNADQIKQNFEEALKEGNLSAAQDFLAQYKIAVTQASKDSLVKLAIGDPAKYAQALQSAIDKAMSGPNLQFKNAGPNSLASKFEDALKVGNLAGAQDFLNQYKQSIDAASVEQNKKADEMAVHLKKAVQEAWQSLMSGAEGFISGLTGISSTLKNTFGVAIPAGMQKTLDIAQGLISIFNDIVKTLESVSKITDAITSLQGGTPSSGGGGLGGLFQSIFGGGGAGVPTIDGMQAQGPSMANGAFVSNTGASTFSQVAGYGAAAYGLYNSYKQGGVAGGAGALVGGGIGAYFGGPIGAGIGSNIGGMLGSKLGGAFSGDNADMDARRTVQEYLQKNLGQNINIGGSGNFNAGASGFDAFNKLPQQSKTAFSAIGDQIKNVLGITQNIGPQIGAILASNIGSGATALKSVMEKLGFSVQQVSDSLIAAGKKGDKTWLEIEGAIEAVDKAANAGKQSVKAAIDEIVTSGGRGQQALDGIRDIALAAQKEGAKTMSDLASKLTASGLTPEQVKEIMDAAKQRGITTLQQLADSSDRTAGAIVADITAMGFQFQQLADNIDKATQAINNLGIASNNVPSVGTSGDTSTTDVTTHALGGIIKKPTFFRADNSLHLMGESGAEAILPLTSINGVLGVKAVSGKGNGQIINFNVDARGAAPGVELMVQNALEDAKTEIIDAAMNAMQHQKYIYSR